MTNTESTTRYVIPTFIIVDAVRKVLKERYGVTEKGDFQNLARVRDELRLSERGFEANFSTIHAYRGTR